MSQSDTLKAVAIGVIVGVIGLAILLVVSQLNIGSSVPPQAAVDLAQRNLDDLLELAKTDPNSDGYRMWIESIHPMPQPQVLGFAARARADTRTTPDEIWCYEYGYELAGRSGYSHSSLERRGGAWIQYGMSLMEWQAAGCG